jgi:hypothetical protein
MALRMEKRDINHGIQFQVLERIRKQTPLHNLWRSIALWHLCVSENDFRRQALELGGNDFLLFSATILVIIYWSVRN